MRAVTALRIVLAWAFATLIAAVLFDAALSVYHYESEIQLRRNAALRAVQP
jgi:hypothetical protein